MASTGIDFPTLGFVGNKMFYSETCHLHGFDAYREHWNALADTGKRRDIRSQLIIILENIVSDMRTLPMNVVSVPPSAGNTIL